VPDGLEAIIFTADGDMRQALNNLQATHFGFGLVDADAVFKVTYGPPESFESVRTVRPCRSSVTSRPTVDSPYIAF
jgi:DNA polymerase III delta prime subunit